MGVKLIKIKNLKKVKMTNPWDVNVSHPSVLSNPFVGGCFRT